MHQAFSGPVTTYGHNAPQPPQDGPEPASLTAGLEALVARSEGLPTVSTADWHSNRIAVRCTPGYATWLGALSCWCDVPTAEVVNQAVRRFAESVGFPAQPPPRLAVPRPTAVVHQVRADFGQATD